MQHTIACCLVLFCATGCRAQQASAAAVTPTGQIAFNRGAEVMLLDVATGVERVLVADNSYARPLCWLPAGDRLVYWNHDGGAWDLWAIAPEAAARKNLTATARDNRSAQGAPDGRSIAFHRGGDGVWLMDADGGNQRQLTKLGHRDAPPVWSPGGRWLAFMALEPAGERRVRVVGHVVDLGSESMPVEPLGRGEPLFFLNEHEVVVSGSHGDQPELVVIDIDNGARRALTDSVEGDESAVLSPDGRRIAWVVHAEEAKRLKTMATDGSDVRDLAAVGHYYAPPSWSPDGRFLCFESGAKRGETQVWIVPAGGGEARAVTTAGGSFPVWRPTRAKR